MEEIVLTEDILSGDFTTDEVPFVKTRLFKALRTALFYGVRAGAAYCIAQGLWYFTVSINGLARYSPVAQTGMELTAIGIFLVLYLTGDEDV
jgi:hypothetical protein